MCLKAIKTHDVEDVCTGSIQALNDTVRNCFYLDRSLVTSYTIKILDHHKISRTKLQAMKLRPSVHRKNANDMTIERKEI